MMKFVFLLPSAGLAEAGRVLGWLDLCEDRRLTEDGRGLMEDGRESNED